MPTTPNQPTNTNTPDAPERPIVTVILNDIAGNRLDTDFAAVETPIVFPSASYQSPLPTTKKRKFEACTPAEVAYNATRNLGPAFNAPALFIGVYGVGLFGVNAYDPFDALADNPETPTVGSDSDATDSDNDFSTPVRSDSDNDFSTSVGSDSEESDSDNDFGMPKM